MSRYTIIRNGTTELLAANPHLSLIRDTRNGQGVGVTLDLTKPSEPQSSEPVFPDPTRDHLSQEPVYPDTPRWQDAREEQAARTALPEDRSQWGARAMDAMRDTAANDINSVKTVARKTRNWIGDALVSLGETVKPAGYGSNDRSLNTAIRSLPAKGDQYSPDIVALAPKHGPLDTDRMITENAPQRIVPEKEPPNLLNVAISDPQIYVQWLGKKRNKDWETTWALTQTKFKGQTLDEASLRQAWEFNKPQGPGEKLTDEDMRALDPNRNRFPLENVPPGYEVNPHAGTTQRGYQAVPTPEEREKIEREGAPTSQGDGPLKHIGDALHELLGVKSAQGAGLPQPVNNLGGVPNATDMVPPDAGVVTPTEADKRNQQRLAPKPGTLTGGDEVRAQEQGRRDAIAGQSFEHLVGQAIAEQAVGAAMAPADVVRKIRALDAITDPAERWAQTPELAIALLGLSVGKGGALERVPLAERSFMDSPIAMANALRKKAGELESVAPDLSLAAEQTAAALTERSALSHADSPSVGLPGGPKLTPGLAEARKGRTVRLYHWSRAKNIDEFNQGDAIGYHFGTEAQARTRAYQVTGQNRGPLLGALESLLPGRGKLVAYDLKITNPLRLTDRGKWTPATMAMEAAGKKELPADIRQRFLDLSKRGPQATGDEFNAILQDAGFDSIVYENKFEGRGDSYIIPRTSRVPNQILRADAKPDFAPGAPGNVKGQGAPKGAELGTIIGQMGSAEYRRAAVTADQARLRALEAQFHKASTDPNWANKAATSSITPAQLDAAKSAGFDTDRILFHGSEKPWASSGVPDTGNQNYYRDWGDGLYMSPHATTAWSYASKFTLQKAPKDAVLMAMVLRKDAKVLDLSKVDQRLAAARLFNLGDNAIAPKGNTGPGGTSVSPVEAYIHAHPAAATAALKKAGYDGLIAAEGQEYVIWNMDKIRHIGAGFDQRKKASPDIFSQNDNAPSDLRRSSSIAMTGRTRPLASQSPLA